MADISPPETAPSQQQPPWVPPGLIPLVFDKFDGLNTQPTRPGIEDQQMFICDGFFPLGPKNLRTLPDVGPAIFSAPAVSTFGQDSFLSASQVALSAHIGNQPYGLTWKKYANATTELYDNPTGANNGYIGATASGSVGYASNVTPPTPNYAVSLQVGAVAGVAGPSTAISLGVTARGNAAPGNGYAAVWKTNFGFSGGGDVELIDVATGSVLADVPVPGAPFFFVAYPLVITITCLNSTIAVYYKDANNKYLTSGGGLTTTPTNCISITDATYAGIGNPGVYASSNKTGNWLGGAEFSVFAIGQLSVVFFDFANIGATPIMIAVVSDGSIWQVNTSTKAATQIAAAGTIPDPAYPDISVSQWGNKYVLIVAKQTNGFWLWDGNNLFQAGTLGPDVTITDNGLDYTSQPTITAFGGSGSGASFVASIVQGIIQSLTVTNPGHGYSGLDNPALAFNGGGCPGATAITAATVTNGTLSHVSVTFGGLKYTSAVSGAVLGGGGAGATVTVTQSGGSITAIGIVAVGQGYSASDPPTVYVTDPNNPVCQATVDTMPFGVSGTTSENYHQQLWVGNGASIEFTAPGSIVNFASSDGGGGFTSTDSFLRVAYTSLKQTNGFLYLIGDSSINYISGVNTSTPQGQTSPVTTFNNVNVSPEVGTPWPAIDVWEQGLLFGNPFGVHITYGGAVKKISEPLDGIFNSAPNNFAGLIPTSGKAIIFGRKVWMILLPTLDQLTGQVANRLFLWDGKRWFSSLQSVPLIFIQHQEINSVLTCYGTDGNAVYPLFQVPSANFTKSVQTKLWDNPSYIMTKTASRLFGLANYNSPVSPDVTISIDNETGLSPTQYDEGPLAATWVNNSDAIVEWTNNAAQPVTWLTSTGIVVFAPVAVAQNGALLGVTLQTNAADLTLISLTLIAGDWQYRG